MTWAQTPSDWVKWIRTDGQDGYSPHATNLPRPCRDVIASIFRFATAYMDEMERDRWEQPLEQSSL